MHVPTLTSELAVRQVQVAEVAPGPVAAEQDAALARNVTHRVRRAYTTACITYALIANTLFLVAERKSAFPLDVGVTIVFFLTFPEILLITCLWSHSLKTRLTALVGYGLAGVLLALFLVGKSRIKLLPILYVHALYPSAGALVLLFKRLQPLLIGLVAVLLYELVGVSILLWWGPALDWASIRPWMIVVGFLNLTAGVMVFGWMLRRQQVAIPVLVLVTMTVVGLAADRIFDSAGAVWRSLLWASRECFAGLGRVANF